MLKSDRLTLWNFCDEDVEVFFSIEMIKDVVYIKNMMIPVKNIDKDNHKSIALFEELNFIQEFFVSTINAYIYVIYGKKKTK